MKTATTSTCEVAERLHLCLSRLPLAENPHARIAELGLDSMDIVELLCVIHEEFGIRLSESDFHPAQTIDGLVSAITAKTTHQPPA
jgi:acyl carrier protein